MASAHARDLRKNLTDAERKLWSRLRQRQLDGYRFRRQVPLGRFIADFACLELKLIVELDGGQHAIATAKDAERGAWCAERGYRVLRFWNDAVLGETESVLEEIRRALAVDRITHA